MHTDQGYPPTRRLILLASLFVLLLNGCTFSLIKIPGLDLPTSTPLPTQTPLPTDTRWPVPTSTAIQ